MPYLRALGPAEDLLGVTFDPPSHLRDRVDGLFAQRRIEVVVRISLMRKKLGPVSLSLQDQIDRDEPAAVE